MPVSFGFSRCSGERTATLRARYSELLVSVVAFRKWAMAETRLVWVLISLPGNVAALARYDARSSVRT